MKSVVNRSKDWIKQAEKDIEAAADSASSKHFEWCCFQAQQGAEKALKALLLSHNLDAWGHGIVHMYKKWLDLEKEDKSRTQPGEKGSASELPEGQDPDGLLASSQELDRHYIQPRYPNGFASGYPAEYYNETLARECLNHARKLLAFAKRKIEEISPPG